MENAYIYIIFIIFILLLVASIILYLFVNKRAHKKDNKFTKRYIEELNKKLLNNPNDYSALYKLATIKDDSGDFEDALKKYEFLLASNYFDDDEKLKVYKRIESICRELKQDNEVFKYDVLITNLDPTDLYYLLKVAYTLYNERKYQLACHYFNKIFMSRKEFTIDELKAAAYSYYSINNYEKTITILEDLSKRMNKDLINFKTELSEVRKALLYMYISLDKLRDAIEYVEYILTDINLDENASIYYDRMYLFILHKLGDDKKFKDVYRKIKATLQVDKLDLKYEELIFDFGFYSYFLGYIDEAIKYFEIIKKFNSTIFRLYEINEVLDYLYQVYRANLQVNKGNRKLSNVYEHNYYKDYIEEKSINEWENTVEAWEKTFNNTEYLNTLIPKNMDNSVDVDNILLSLKITNNININDKHKNNNDDSKNYIVDKIYTLNFNNFKKLCKNIITNKLSYTIVQEFTDNTDNNNIDEIDYLAYDNKLGKNNLTFISFKRWQNNKVGELILRDFLVKIKDSDAKNGILIVPVELTSSAKSYAAHSEIITIYARKQLNNLLKGEIF